MQLENLEMDCRFGAVDLAQKFFQVFYYVFSEASRFARIQPLKTRNLSVAAKIPRTKGHMSATVGASDDGTIPLLSAGFMARPLSEEVPHKSRGARIRIQNGKRKNVR